MWKYPINTDVDIQIIMMHKHVVKPNDLKILYNLIYLSKKAYEMGLTIGKSGNVSGRIRDNIIIIKKTGRSLSRLTPKDFVIVDIISDNVPKNVSSDYLIHREIYLNNPNVKYILHVHPAKLIKLTLSTKESKITPQSYEGKIFFGNEIPIVREEHDNLHRILKKHIDKKFLIEAGHGVYVYSDNPDEILPILEELEYIAFLSL